MLHARVHPTGAQFDYFTHECLQRARGELACCTKQNSSENARERREDQKEAHFSGREVTTLSSTPVLPMRAAPPTTRIILVATRFLVRVAGRPLPQATGIEVSILLLDTTDSSIISTSSIAHGHFSQMPERLGHT